MGGHGRNANRRSTPQDSPPFSESVRLLYFGDYRENRPREASAA
jgi:hypothetical protein